MRDVTVSCSYCAPSLGVAYAQTTRSERPVIVRAGVVGGDPAGRSRLRVPRYVFERLLVDDVAIQCRMTAQFNLHEDHLM